MDQSSTTFCQVDIVAPGGASVTFGSSVREGSAWAGNVPIAGGLLAVETGKDLGQAVGYFTLTFDAIRDRDGKTWAERIPMRSLVTIVLDRPTEEREFAEDPTVMVGLTDTHTVQDSFSEAAPRRVVQIRGRELSCVILDAQLLFHPLLFANPAYGTLTVASEAWGELQMALSMTPDLVEPREPKALLQIILDTYLFVGGGAVPSGSETAVPLQQQAPLITIDLPGTTLSELLEPNYAAWSTFEPAIAWLGGFPARVGSLWNYLHLFIDRAFQEFFTRIEGGKCRLYFRGKPFRHDLITSGTRFKDNKDERTLLTLPLDPREVLAQTRTRDSSQVYNFFSVMPRGLMDLKSGPFFRSTVFPQVITDPAHPSFVGRYGLRVYEVQSPYLSALTPPAPPGMGASTSARPMPLKPLPEPVAGSPALANQIAADEGIPAALRPWFVANLHQESRFNPLATSPAGAQGAGQLMPGTQALVGVTQPYDLQQSLRGSARYWNILRAYPFLGDNPTLLVAAYNAGPGAVQTHKGIPPFPETQQHVLAVTSFVPLYAHFAGETAPVTQAPPAPQAETPAGDDIVAQAKRWASILRAWYDMGGELFGGTLTVRGHPSWNIGHRLLSWDERGEWEAYIEGVQHRYDVRSGQYLTTLRYTRGWYLSAAVAQAVWEEGQTTVTHVSGGPPTLDPATGDEVAAPGFKEVIVVDIQPGP